ncbi:hypothetical protein predicted by Glimmer/Critica [Limosilactobacillus fermentum]|nr:hypothetical protein predicted by Glimmer/Critica [Limosilactobacillus fermentum]
MRWGRILDYMIWRASVAEECKLARWLQKLMFNIKWVHYRLSPQMENSIM